MTMLPTFLAGTTGSCTPPAGSRAAWSRASRSSSLDVELLQMLQAEFTPLEIDEESLAFGAHEEVGHGGHFLGAMHTMERFRTCFYRPFCPRSDNYERWMRSGAGHGGPGARSRQGKLEEYEAPPSTTPSARSWRST